MTTPPPSTPAVTMPATVLPLLADPAGYQRSHIDPTSSEAELEYWIGLFKRQIVSILEHAQECDGDSPDFAARAGTARAEVEGFLDSLRHDPHRHGRLDLLVIDHQRDGILRRHGFHDPHRLVKAKENVAALELLPAVLDELDALAPAPRLDTLVRNAFAGNVFDLGVTESIERFRDRGADFFRTRDELPPRPWLVDDFDAFARRWLEGPPFRRAILLVDNAGADVVLGMLPLARELLRGGGADVADPGPSVVLSANTLPTLNDITHPELTDLIQQAAALDPILAEGLAGGRLELVPSGNAWPLMDMRQVSPELAAACDGADLLVLEGMGRAVETNFHARFTCDCLKLAMLKDSGVAASLGGKSFDVVLRYDPAQAGHAETPGPGYRQARD